MTSEELTTHVRCAINPQFENWVLFRNGTYIVFDNPESISDIRKEATDLMKEFGPVHVGGPAGDFGVIALSETDGWVVSGHGYGMYTYVHPTELDNPKAADLEIGLYGREKRDADGGSPEIIFINEKQVK